MSAATLYLADDSDRILVQDIARISNPALQRILPPRNTLCQSFTRFQTVLDMKKALRAVLIGIEGVEIVTASEDTHSMLIRATGNTWSRAARRRKLAAMDVTADDGPQSQFPALTCRIRCLAIESGVQQNRKSGNLCIEFTWMRGRDRALFESFMSHVARKVEGTA